MIKRASRGTGAKQGFTIVELLIVIVVIAILAAITIVAYTGIQNRAYDTAVQNDLASIGKKIELYATDNEGVYPSDLQTALLADPLYAVSVSRDAYAQSPNATYNLTYCVNGTGTQYALAARTKAGSRYSISNVNGLTEYTGLHGWDGSGSGTLSNICTSALSGTTQTGLTGYRSDVSPQWRSWTGS